MEGSGRNAGIQTGQLSHSRCHSTNERLVSEGVPKHGARVLVIDDEQGIRRFLRTSLTTQGYEMYEASTGQEGLQSVPIVRPDLIILDFGLPDLDGVDVTRSLREWTQTPILILSVREQESDKVAALDAGADDYLTKPFGVGELLARIRAALRRTNNTDTGAVFATGDLQVDLARRIVQLNSEKVQLTPTEYDLLKVLVRHADRVLTHRQVIREVWGGACYEDEMHLLRVNISNLRRKLETDPARPHYILTEPGVGYRLRTE
jgi:two-component system, OmpR family, KDP operon response regulator KdpE